MNRRSWIQSYSGRVVTPGELQVEQVSLADIPHALSQKVRFGGQLAEPYSVAQHCVMGADCIASAFRLAFLLHEVSEVYLPDIPTPIKNYTKYRDLAWSALEAEHARVIFNALSVSHLLPLLSSAPIQEMDRAMLLTEKRDLCGPSPASWGVPGEPVKGLKISNVWSAEEAEYRWHRLYASLRGQR